MPCCHTRCSHVLVHSEVCLSYTNHNLHALLPCFHLPLTPRLLVDEAAYSAKMLTYDCHCELLPTCLAQLSNISSLNWL